MKTFILKLKFWKKASLIEKNNINNHNNNSNSNIISSGNNSSHNNHNDNIITQEETQFQLLTSSSHYIPITTGPITKSPTLPQLKSTTSSELCSISQSFSPIKIIENLIDEQNNIQIHSPTNQIENNSNNSSSSNNTNNNNNGNNINKKIEIPKLNLLKIQTLSVSSINSSLSPNSTSTASSNNNNNTGNNNTNTNKDDESPRSHSYMGIRNLFSTSPRNSILQKSPRHHRSNSIFSPFVNNNNNSQQQQQYNSNNLQNLPQHLIEDILYNCMDFLLPSFNYIEMCTVSKCFNKVIESMRGFILIIGISDTQSHYAINWYQKNYKRVSKLKFVNNFFKNPNNNNSISSSISNILNNNNNNNNNYNNLSQNFLNIFSNIPHDPSLDLSESFISPELLVIISQKLLINDCFMELNLTKTTSVNQDYIQNEIIQFFKSLSLNSSLTNLQLNSSTISTALSNQPLISTSLTDYDVHRINFLDLGGLNLSLTVVESFSKYLRNNTSLLTLIYNNNPQGLFHILLVLARANQTLTHLNISECNCFDSLVNLEATQILLKSNRTLKQLDISKNSFNTISQSTSSFFNSLSLNTSIEYLNISSTCQTTAHVNLFPILGKFFNNINNNEISNNNNNNNNNNINYICNIKTLIISSNYPFPLPNVYQQSMDFIQSEQTITHLDLSNLRLTDEKFKPIITSLSKNSFSKSNLKILNISINRLRIQSAIEISKYLESNTSLENLNLGLNFIKDGVTKICNSLIHNKTLKIINLYATQIKSKEAKSISKLLEQNKTITELDIGLNIDIDPVLNHLSENPESSIKILHIGSTSLKKSFVKFLTKNQSITTLDITNSTFSNLSYKSLNLINPLLKSKSITKLNFNIEDLNASKNSRLKIKYYPNKYYYFNK